MCRVGCSSRRRSYVLFFIMCVIMFMVGEGAKSSAGCNDGLLPVHKQVHRRACKRCSAGLVGKERTHWSTGELESYAEHSTCRKRLSQVHCGTGGTGGIREPRCGTRWYCKWWSYSHWDDSDGGRSERMLVKSAVLRYHHSSWPQRQSC